MKISVDIGHPAHVHFFKNFIYQMGTKGHETLVTASDKDVSLKLLEKFNIDYVNMGSYGDSVIHKIINIPGMDYKMYKRVKRFKPDIFMGIGSIRSAHVSYLLNKPCVIFDDTEHAQARSLYLPFVDYVLTPSTFINNLGRKQIKYQGYHELAYLHPNWFKPNADILDELNLDKQDNLILLRVVSWSAYHDLGHKGISELNSFIKVLEKYGTVLLSSEKKIPPLEKYYINVSPEKIHDLLFYCSLYIGEGATMVTESALLGTPAIYISTLSGTMGNLIELEEKYDLAFSFTDTKMALEKTKIILENANLKEEWNKKRNQLLSEKIDVTEYMINFINDIISD